MEAVVIGAGGSGLLHALALRAAGARIGGVYDPDRARAESLADLCGGRVLDSITSAASSDARIAAICSPPHVHVAQAEALACSGRAVFVEKPVAIDRAELARLRALPGCVPVLQWRAGRALRALRRAVALGELGPAPVVACELAWPRDDAYLRVRAGWGCGAVLSVGIHALDALAWALGPIACVAGRATSRPGAAHETAVAAVLRFESGAIASFALSLDGAGPETTRITLSGGGVTVRLEGGEADPTGGMLAWSAHEAGRAERLAELEASTAGALGMPLLVPYLGAALAAIRDGERPGESERLPSIHDTFHAHAAATMIAEPVYVLPPLATATRAALPALGSDSVRVTAVSDTP